MLKVLKNLKKSFWSVVVIVILLCIQAAADLALPDYTSKIVNTGIQAGGIETAVPKVISSEDMQSILIFSDKDEDITSNYSLVGETLDRHQENTINKYFGKDYKVEPNTIYVLNEIEDEKEQELSEIIAEPLMETTTLKNEETANKIKEKMTANIPEEQKAYIENMSLMEIIQNLPEEQRETLVGEFTKYIDNLEPTIKEQGAVASVKELYAGMGVDTNKIQNDYILLSGLQMLGVALVSMLSAVTIMLLSSRVAAKLGKTLRDKVFKKVIGYSSKELREFSTASLITRSTNDIQQIQQLITMLFRVVVYAPIIGIGGFIKVLTNSDNQMAWIVGVAIVAILFIVATLFIIVMPKFRKLQDLIDLIKWSRLENLNYFLRKKSLS